MTKIGATIIASFILISCSQNPTEIKLSDLKTACDYANAIEKYFDALIELKGETEKFYDLPKNEQEYAKQLKDKLEEILKAGEKKYTEAEIKECGNFERIEEKGEKVSKFFW
jgi:bacterioferritin (cytochrome b1)